MSSDEPRAGIPSRQAADLLIDSARLSELVGRPVRATRLRHKPGLSTRAVLLDTAANCPPGWVQVTHRRHADKLHNARRRAGDRGQHIELRDVPASVAAGDLMLAFGTVDSDPRLQRGLDIVRETYPSVHEALASGRLSVLRYNPQRRLVLRCEQSAEQTHVLRVTADKQRGVHQRLAAIADAGVPVLQPFSSRITARTRRVTVWPWFGTGDLEHASHEDAAPYASDAGHALAALHAVPVEHLKLGPVPDPRVELSTLVADLQQIDTDAAARMRPLVEQVTARIARQEWESGVAHGDFSADQVLISASAGPFDERLVLSDFDRVGVGPLAMDIGTFAAAELLSRGAAAQAGQSARRGRIADIPLTSALVTGYTEARGGDTFAPDPVWVARALLARASEPFRSGNPAWQQLVHERLDQVRQVLS